ncbi:uncharacterized protein MELLADRAFT_72052 [Melampsora larici-populina 98AG31]|uniref:Uncharacterized protein n=1 Tax=Melampsora larici-populina (strain 98AG31 / pathotype 3-4-7) TaxID=747676 RepID=F4RP97_MELLP|nr:uncharacterized protein MELLADRAFT_72052 [Melampsora larici-populina 98AG31]EGG05887.1 hypothetical protein MELLADRAFT_72052 [Melampsora larici-populina 98AG31]
MIMNPTEEQEINPQPSSSTNHQPTSDNIHSAPPPSYAEAHLLQPYQSTQSISPHPFESSHHFPDGLFIIKNRSSEKVLDVRGGASDVGSEVIAYQMKRPVLIDGDLMHRKNNQLFFLDWHGCLCAANSRLTIDVDPNFGLFLSSPQPICSNPNPSSHPPPQFLYDLQTRTISVQFSHDPTYSGASLEQIHSVDYLLEVQPKSKLEQPPPTATALEKLSEWIPFTRSPPLSNSSRTSPSTSTAASQLPSFQASVDFLNTSSDPDLDDSSDPSREVRVVSVAPGWREKFPSSNSPEASKWLKRQFDLAKIVRQARRDFDPNSGLDLSHLDPDASPLDQGALSELGDVLGEIGTEISRAFRRST